MSSNDEFKIQPHPQDNHSNTPASGGPTSLKEGAIASNPGPRILDNETASKLEKPNSKEEQAKISASLNK
ncbi:hypothetical protein CBS101457_005625 [Exobasidium rhododendri]|nr:hypothetical protein CBS101457_005625 [Exobasidium rhododendri]